MSLSTAIEQLIQFGRRQKFILIAGPLAGVLIALVYLLFMPSLYTATATILIDGNAMRVLDSDAQRRSADGLDALQVASQVDILESDNLALAVIRKLKLTADPEFVKHDPGPATASSESEGNEAVEAAEREALDEFAARRGIVRLEKTYAVDVSFTSRSPLKAARIANAIAEAYINDQLEVRDQTRRRAGAWLEDRIEALKAQVTAADKAVLEYKEKNKIVDLAAQGAGQGAPSRLIGEQQLSELNSQLAAARGATSDARARLERIEEVRKRDVSDAVVADTLRNDVITRLRNKYIDLSAHEATITARYGSDHEAAVNLRNQMAEVSRSISAELGRIAASYQSDYEIAKAREENLQRDLANVVREGRVTNRDRIGLAELQSSANVYHSFYDSFLQRYMDAVQQQSFPIAEARVISYAAPPSRRSRPHRLLALTIGATMGFIFSLGGAAFREVNDGVFRTGRQVEERLQLPCLAVVPNLSASDLSVPANRETTVRRRPQDRGPDLADSQALAERTAGGGFVEPIMRYAVEQPLSVFAEAIRAIKVSVGPHQKTIGVTSAFPGEGKSTISCNLATLMADAGKRVILVDADLRNPKLARSLHPRPDGGLIELLDGQLSLQQAVLVEPKTRLHVLPSVIEAPLAHADEILSSHGFKSLIDQLREVYDCVILDLPPLAPVVDVRAALAVIDSLVFVTAWGSSKITAVQSHLAAADIRERLTGVALNKANLKELQKFDVPGLHHEGYYANLGYSRTIRTS